MERKFQEAKVPGIESSKGAKDPGNESSTERKFHGTKVPRNESSCVELSLQGAKSLGNEKSWYPALDHNGTEIGTEIELKRLKCYTTKYAELTQQFLHLNCDDLTLPTFLLQSDRRS